LCLVINPSSVEAVTLTAGRKQKAKQTHQLATKVKKNPSEIASQLTSFLSLRRKDVRLVSFKENKRALAFVMCH
jgi:transposase